MRVFVHSRRGLGLRQHRRRYAAGLAQDPAPYGFDLAETRGVGIAFSQDGPYERVSRKSIDRIAFDPAHALYNLRAMRRADVIWTVLEWDWLSVSFMQRLGLLPPVPVIGNSVWLFDHWPVWSGRRRRLLRWLMADNIHLTLHARPALELSRRFVPDRSFHLSPFGISTRVFPLTEPVPAPRGDRPLRIYAIGNDGTRDWQTLLDAFGNDPRFELTILCRWLGERHDVASYTNLRWPDYDSGSGELRRYNEWADVVVVPMRENPYSGITAACEAVATGKPVIASHTGGVPTYFDPGEVVYVPPSDPAALRYAALGLTPQSMRQLALRAQDRFRRSGYAAQDMVDRYIAISRSLLETGSKAAQASPA